MIMPPIHMNQTGLQIQYGQHGMGTSLPTSGVLGSVGISGISGKAVAPPRSISSFSTRKGGQLRLVGILGISGIALALLRPTASFNRRRQRG